MKVLFINNDGGGFADYIEVDEATTVRALFKREVPHGEPEGYLIRVNRQPAAADQVLQNLDRVSFTATKIEGARFLSLELGYLLPPPCPLTQETPCQLEGGGKSEPPSRSIPTSPALAG